MNNNSILLLNPDFEPSLSSILTLLVKIGTDTFSYAIIDEKNKYVHALYDEQECDSGYDKLKERLKIDAYLQLDYKKVNVAANTINQVFVPQELFATAEVSSYSKFFADDDFKKVYVQPILAGKLSFSSVFAFDAALEHALDSCWKGSIKAPDNIGLVSLAAKSDQDTVIIDFSVKSFHIVFSRAKTIAFAQSYQFEDIDELTYFIMLVIKQLNIDNSKTDLKLCGIIHEGDDKWNLLNQYFKNIDFLIADWQLDTNILDDMPAHYYTSLLALHQCG